jgi:hypothetical protein
VELQELAAVANQIISVRECKPIISIVQDVALGVYRFTKSGVRLNEKQVMNLLASNPKGTCIVPPAMFVDGKTKRWNGRQIMSTIIPKNTNLRVPNKSFDEEKVDDSENYVVVENGEHKQGIMDKLVYQNRTRGLIHSIFNECGSEETRLFLDNTQKVICDWLVQSGYSVGVSDIITDSQTDSEIKKTIHDMKVEVYDKIRDIHTGNFENNSINANSAYFEEEVNRILNTTSNKVGKIAKAKINDLDNRMINMVNAGSKGSIINVSQMMACLGQVNVEGKRIAYGFDDRTLPHYTKFDDGPESRGFVENSFIKGLTPQEFFFHAMGGREGLIDTAVKSVTGDTPIIIIENNVPKYVAIGDWIDAHLYAEKENVRHFEERQMELLDIKHMVYIHTLAYDGLVTWGTITAITRHDPGNELYKITTQSGRSVIVTESKSLLVWQPEIEEFREVLTPDIKEGDFVPTTAYQPAPPITLDHLDLAPPGDIVFGDYVPDRFEFTRDNGIALGRYLASDGTRRNMVPEIEKFVEVHVPGATKYIPEVAYVAKQDFIEGLLIGYFTCGTTQFLPHAVQTKEVTQRMCDGLCTLLSRYGVFASYSPAEKQLSIKGMWKKVFVDQLWPRMMELPTPHSTSSIENKWKNHVVLDKILSIEIISIENYPKVYDLTIPETLNFGLANGLQVRDTSETGYIQRKLVKAMEDCKISYDYTVRNASGAIVQFLYGEDGMEASKIESQPLLYIEKDFEKLKKEYLLAPYDDMKYYLNDETLKEFLETKDWEATMEAHFRQVLADREYIITKIYDGKKETSILYPISLMRLINNARALFKDKGLSDLNPMYVLKTIEEVGNELYVNKTNRGTMVLKMLLRCYLSPKKVATEYKFNKSTFDYMIQQIKHKFYEAIANPSEMVGVIAAQSIGEPSTQIVCQSVTGSFKRV